MVPHLITALTGPINELEQRMLDAMPAIERWFRLEWMEHTPPFYTSVDLRNAGFKLAPVDTSLFPHGWHHLTAEMMPLAVQAAMAAIEKICPEARNLLIVPENRLQSPSDVADLAQLQRIFNLAGLNVRVGSIDPELKKATTFQLADGQSVAVEPALRVRKRVGLRHFDPCTILLNNELPAGPPGILEDLYEQYLLPPLQAGWTVRRRSRHTRCYEEVGKRFGKMLGIDHWLIHPISHSAEAGKTKAKRMEALRAAVDQTFSKVRRKYKEYGIGEKPFVVIKADDAGDEAGVAVLRDAKDLPALEESGQLPRSGHWLVQEGVLTQERVHEAVAEPVVYTMDRYVVGGVYRMHLGESVGPAGRARGASYVPLAFEHSTQLPQPGERPGASAPNRFYMYGVVARLAMLAASYELEATDPEMLELA
ncbi:glutamate--cysteine ligase [Comamonas sp. NLF-1-9]|uniref:glutamate--cysteine ligase n=1 Tax=Comamonas sp. NLF-1-9 TaxID=2853163 RepID=UPI001C4448CB|nr:glutamate--cysteine ligase [Comamonas sp. NLF-1-9]QXL84143.1 glutamate--cysteine ligase [Comamonas sp. NLF-1-9]